jgi:hypothetical protein
MVSTGRIDQRSSHDGVPAEPMTIFVKWLAREARERTRWAQRFLQRAAVTWQFDTADGLKCAAQFESATGVVGRKPLSTLILRTGSAERRQRSNSSDRAAVEVHTLPANIGVLGDGSLAYQAELTKRLRRWIEQAAG